MFYNVQLNIKFMAYHYVLLGSSLENSMQWNLIVNLAANAEETLQVLSTSVSKSHFIAPCQCKYLYNVNRWTTCTFSYYRLKILGADFLSYVWYLIFFWRVLCTLGGFLAHTCFHWKLTVPLIWGCSWVGGLVFGFREGLCISVGTFRKRTLTGKGNEVALLGK